MRARFALAAALIAAPLAAHAQVNACTVPATLPPVHADGPSAQTPRRVMPVTRYTLAVSWSPGFCYGKADVPEHAFQCGGDQRFGFVLHGLWPDGPGQTWPQYCRPAAILPERVIRDHLCTTPSAQLVQHEWAKHGTCLPTTPDKFFAQSRKLYRALRFPDMAALARRDDLTVGKMATAFAAVNRGIRPDALRVTVSRSGWLDEIWICLDTKLRYAACPAGGGAARGTRLRITPPA